MERRRRELHILTDDVQRFHFGVDRDAEKLNGFEVGLATREPMIVRATDKESFADLWSDALGILRRQREAYWRNALYPREVFDPYGFITAIDIEREAVKLGITVNMLVGGAHPDGGRGHPDHMQRVQALCKAYDLLTFGVAALPKGFN